MLTLDWQIIFTFINIIVLFLFLKFFLFGKLQKIAEQRQAIIQKSLDEAEEKNKQAAEKVAQYEEKLSDAREEAQRMIHNASQQANAQAEQIVTQAQASAQRIQKDAQASIEQERKKALDEVSSSVAGIALLAAAKVAQKNLDEGSNEPFVEAFLKDAGARHE